MNKLLYISPFLLGKRYGGSIVSKSNLQAIKNSYPGKIKYITFDSNISNLSVNKDGYIIPVNFSKFKVALSNLQFYPGRLNKNAVEKLKDIIINESPTEVYFDSSVFGCVIKSIIKDIPNIKVITYFHNVEFDFEIQRLKKMQLKYFPSFLSVLFNERKSVQYSDYLVSLHTTDSDRILDLYGKYVDYIVPVSSDTPKFKKENFDMVHLSQPVFGFLGSAFYANIEAANHIRDIALSFPDFKFLIAGRGFDDYQKELSASNVKILGELDSLDEFYQNIDVFIAPIYSGAGMKVKISEAMSYNIPIIASEFSLIGYDEVRDKGDIFCAKSLGDFFSILSSFDFCSLKLNNSYLFEKYYSSQSNTNRFLDIWNEVL